MNCKLGDADEIFGASYPRVIVESELEKATLPDGVRLKHRAEADMVIFDID